MNFVNFIYVNGYFGVNILMAYFRDVIQKPQILGTDFSRQ